jgi:hypothetical protein
MPDKSNDYRFVTRWVVESTCEEVSDVLGNPLDLPRWWPMVYLAVTELRPPNASGTGRRVRLLTKGKLPYKLTWLHDCGDGRFRGHRDVDLRAERPARRHHVRLADSGGKSAAAVALVRVEAEECLVRELARRKRTSVLGASDSS